MKKFPIVCLLSLTLPVSVWAADSAPPVPAPAPGVPAPGDPAPGGPAAPSGPAASTQDSHAGHNHKAAAPDPNEGLVDYLWRKSDQAFHDGEYERAIGLHKAIVALAPDDVESYSVAAWLMWSLGNGDEAIQWLRKGIAANPRDWQMWDAAGQNFDLQKKFADSKDAYSHAVELTTKEDDSQMLRRRFAHASEKAGDVATSQRIWQELVREFPTDAVNKNNLQRVEALAAAKG